jgi:anti-sigma factor RsiW
MMAPEAHHGAMSYSYFPIDVKALSRQALRGSGPEDPEPLAPRKRYRWLRRQPTERPRSIPVSPASSRARASARSVPSSVR